MKKVIIYTDGACSGNPGPGGWGTILMYKNIKKEIKNLFTKAMSGIQFESGRDIIKEISFPILDQIVAILELNPEYHLTISGHTDNDGDEDKNMNLSISRAAAVAKYIENKGIAAERLTSQGFGENRPIADNKTTKGRAKNRRVEFEISYEEITYEKVVNPELQEVQSEEKKQQ